MKQMDVKKFLIPFVAVLTVFLIASVSALGSNVVTEFNGVELSTSGMSMAGIADDVVPIRVTFNADSDTEDVRVRVWMEGYRDEVSVKTDRFGVLQGVTYTKLLSLELPEDLKDTSQDFTLHVSISSADEYDSVDYDIRMQRETYSFNILSVDYPVPVSAGDVMPVSVVVENNGMQDLDDGFVTITIPELDVSAKGYFGDLVSIEDDDNEDSTQKTVYVKLPSDANKGVYEMKIRVYNRDASQTVSQLIRIDGSDAGSTVLAGTRTKQVRSGQSETFELIIVNSGSEAQTYNLEAVSPQNTLAVSVPSVIAVGAGSSQTVSVSVAALSNAQEGVYPFSVEVDGQRVNFEAEVVGQASGIVALTVVLVIVFVVLLVVLVVLLTRKDKSTEEVETSYY